MKRVLSVLLVLCLLAEVLSMSVSAEALEGSCGENATWVLDTATGLLTISGTGPMNDYSHSTSAPWSKYKLKIRKVVVNSGIAANACVEISQNCLLRDKIEKLYDNYL